MRRCPLHVCDASDASQTAGACISSGWIRAALAYGASGAIRLVLVAPPGTRTFAVTPVPSSSGMAFILHLYSTVLRIVVADRQVTRTCAATSSLLSILTYCGLHAAVRQRRLRRRVGRRNAVMISGVSVI